MHTHEYEDLRGALSVDAFCKLYGLGRTCAYEQIKDGRLRAVKCGNRTLVLRRDAEAWARSLPTLGAEND
jgi:excisionase family DNA binding protein